VSKPPSASSAQSSDGWRPIESAPKDGTHILACANYPSNPYSATWTFNQRPPTVVHWFPEPGEEGFYLSHGTGDLPPFEATHWMPLPNPPGEPS